MRGCGRQGVRHGVPGEHHVGVGVGRGAPQAPSRALGGVDGPLGQADAGADGAGQRGSAHGGLHDLQMWQGEGLRALVVGGRSEGNGRYLKAEVYGG